MTNSTTIALQADTGSANRNLSLWLPVALGLLVLYVPTYRDLSELFWAREGGAPGIVVAIWMWLLWRERAALLVERRTLLGFAIGWSAIAIGGVMYALGRSQQMFQLEAGSQLLVMTGIALALLGPASTRRLWFVLAFLVFTVPLPGSFMDSLLVPLKEFVSAFVTNVLFAAGLPIARDGVVIYVGPYQMFIADACSGLNQLVALTAIGVLYVHLAAYRKWWPTWLLLAAIAPVAIVANLVRVLTLVLATYFGGDDLGSRLHDYVGFAEIALAFGAFFLLDHLMRFVLRAQGKTP
jgi:exosortase